MDLDPITHRFMTIIDKQALLLVECTARLRALEAYLEARDQAFPHEYRGYLDSARKAADALSEYLSDPGKKPIQ
jgi:hypothetical protein